MALRSRITELREAKGWSSRELVGHLMIAGLGQDTAYRVSRGDTALTVETLAVVARVLGVSNIGEIIVIEPEAQ